MKNIKLLASGQQTSAIVAQILPTSHNITVPSVLRPVELRPGAIWSNNKMLIYASESLVLYTIGDSLFESGTGMFILDEWLNAEVRAAAAAMPMVTLLKTEIALLTGIFVPWYILLGMTVAKIGLLYFRHKSLVNQALQQAPNVILLLNDFRTRHPLIFNKMMTTAAKTILVNLPFGVTAEDVGFFIGRVIRGVSGLPGVTLGAVLKIIIAVATIVGITHLPHITAEGLEVATRENMAIIQGRLAEAGINVSKEEARMIMQQLLSDPDAIRKNRELQKSLQQLIPILKQLQQAILLSKD
jgi:hypothetical protein